MKKENRLRPYICERCGGTIDRVRMVCEYCGTMYEEDNGAYKIVVESPNIILLSCEVEAPYEARRMMGDADFSEFISREIAKEMVRKIGPGLDLEHYYDPYGMTEKYRARIRLVRSGHRL